jgi:hypothetical protein
MIVGKFRANELTKKPVVVITDPTIIVIPGPTLFITPVINMPENIQKQLVYKKRSTPFPVFLCKS